MADSRLGKTKNAVAATTQLHFLFQECLMVIDANAGHFTQQI